MRLSRILQLVADDAEIEIGEITRARPTQAHIRHQQAAIYLMRHLTPASFPEIARVVKREAASVQQAYARAAKRQEEDGRFAGYIKRMRAMLQREEDAIFGMRDSRVVLIGDGPAGGADAGLPLHPAPMSGLGGRLMNVAGLSANEYLTCTRRAWLIPYGIAEGWQPRLARAAAVNLEALLDGFRLICVGRRVTEAFGISPDAGRLQWCARVTGSAMVSSIPDPISDNAWYSDPGNQRLARKFLRTAVLGDEEER